MAAKKKSASRRPAAKAKGKKAAKRPAAKKKAAARKGKPAAKKSAARRTAPPSPAVAELDRRIALVRNNLRDLIEQAAATSGSGSEEALSGRIASQEAELQRLTRERDALAKR